MVIDENVLINELQSLARQKADAQALLARLDGAEQVVRHLLAKAATTVNVEELAEEIAASRGSDVNGEAT